MDTHKTSMVFRAAISTKLANPQQHDLRISYTECRPDRTVNVKSTDSNFRTPIINAWLSLPRFKRNSQSPEESFGGHPSELYPNRIKNVENRANFYGHPEVFQCIDFHETHICSTALRGANLIEIRKETWKNE
jgi:hypothetical protein